MKSRSVRSQALIALEDYFLSPDEFDDSQLSDEVYEVYVELLEEHEQAIEYEIIKEDGDLLDLFNRIREAELDSSDGSHIEQLLFKDIENRTHKQLDAQEGYGSERPFQAQGVRTWASNSSTYTNDARKKVHRK